MHVPRALAHRWAPVGIGLAALAAALAWSVLGGGGANTGRPRPPYVLPVTLAPVVQRDVSPSVALTGTVRPARATFLAFEVAGVVSSVDVLAGDSIRANEVVARLDARDLELGVASRNADLLFAERELAELAAGARAEERERLAAEVVIANAGEALAQLEVDRGRRLVARGSLTQGELDQREANLAMARGRVAAAAAQAREAEAGPRPEALEVARARCAQAGAALNLARRDAEKAVLRAPWDGAIQRHQVSAGAYVDKGDAVSVLIDDRYLEIEVEIPSRFGHRLGSKAKVRITSADAPDLDLEASLDTRLPAADAVSRNVTGVVRLWRKSDGSVNSALHPSLEPGMFVRVDVHLEPLSAPLVVPPDAVRMTKKGAVIVRAAPGAGGALQAEWIPVRLLGADAAGQAILSLGAPIAPGDRVVLTGVDLAFPGVPLLPREGAPSAAPAATEGAR